VGVLIPDALCTLIVTSGVSIYLHYIIVQLTSDEAEKGDVPVVSPPPSFGILPDLTIHRLAVRYQESISELSG
jgi:hypothetical protein